MSEDVIETAWEVKLGKVIVDQGGQIWMSFTDMEKTIWFSIQELREQQSAVLKRLDTVGIKLISHGSINRFKTFVERNFQTVPGLVASQPGWVTDDTYVFGDGSVVGTHSEVIVTFEPHPKLGSAGSLKAWKKELTPFGGQALVEAIFVATLIGPLLRFCPHVGSPIIELVGPTHAGKTTLARAAFSVWGGSSESTIGAMDSWDLTEGAIDKLKEEHRDGALGLDEGNLAETTSQEIGKFLRRAIFKLSGTDSRSRANEVRSKQARTVTISTNNEPLSALLGGSHADKAAVSRVITVPFSRDWATPELIAALEMVGRDNYGTAARAFVSRLARHKPEFVATTFTIGRFLSGKRIKDDPRRATAAGLLVAAAFISVLYQVFPRTWSPIESVLKVLQGVEGLENIGQAAAREIIGIIENSQVVDATKLSGPMSKQEFDAALCILRVKGRRNEVLMPAQALQQKLPQYKAAVAVLRNAGCARTEGGEQPKLTIKCPTDVCETGRVYCFDYAMLKRLAA